MTVTTEPNPVVAIDDRFYAVTRPFGVGPLGDEATLTRVPLGNQPPEAPRRIAMPVLDALVKSGDAVFVDARLLEAATRRLAPPQAEMDAGRARTGPGAKPAFERLLRLLQSGDIRSAASMLDPGDELEPV